MDQDNLPTFHLVPLRERPGGRERRVTQEFLKWVEERASELRHIAGVSPTGKLDPRGLAKQFNILIPELDQLVALSREDREHISSVDARIWSGGGVPPPGGGLLVLLNPHQTTERAAVTIMEEGAHAHLRHRPSHIVKLSNGVTTREYDADAERQAYCVAAASLVPRHVVAKAVWQGRSAESVATEFGVSQELVEMRIKVLKLWWSHVGRLHRARKTG